MTDGPASNARDSVCLLQLTDPHLFSDGQGALAGVSTSATWHSVLSEVQRRGPRPDAVLVTGDLVHDHRESTYRRLMDDLQVFDAPVYVLPGNHDDGSLMASVFADHDTIRWVGHVVLGEWLVVMLDSTIAGSPGGHLSSDELDRLARTLRDHAERPTLVALHHHPVDVGSAWIDAIGVDNGQDLMELLERHPQARIVLWGHVHQEVDQRLGALRMLATPSTCIQFLPGARNFTLDEIAPGWRYLRLQADGGVETWVERLERLPTGLDLGLRGY